MIPKTQLTTRLGIVVVILGTMILYWLGHTNYAYDSHLIAAAVEYPYQKEIPPPPEIPTIKQILSKNYLVVSFWNVENLFDTQDDPFKDDEEFTPDGGMGWTEKVLQKKLYNLTDVIRRIDDGYGPDILGLGEVENMNILGRLAQHPNLKGLGYQYGYLKEGNDFRGIDVALISRYRAEVTWHKSSPGSREILQAKFEIRGHVLYVFVNHWRSRLGGKAASESRRVEAAQSLAKLIQKTLQVEPDADIAVLGDFNDNPDDFSMENELGATIYKGRLNKSSLYNLSYSTKPDPWIKTRSHFDQIIISRGLFNPQGFRYIPKSFKIVGFPYMCNQYGSAMRFSTTTKLGYSDHFPILAYLQMPKTTK